MNNITAKEAKNLLLTYESENAAVLEEIDFMARNAAENEYLTLGNALIIHWLFRGENSAAYISTKASDEIPSVSLSRFPSAAVAASNFEKSTPIPGIFSIRRPSRYF